MENEIIGTVQSELNEAVSISFGHVFTEENSKEENDWILEGVGDSFWENFYLFEPELKRAKEKTILDNNLSDKEALFEVFGHFTLSFEGDCDNEITKRYVNFEIDEMMYSLLCDVIENV